MHCDTDKCVRGSDEERLRKFPWRDDVTREEPERPKKACGYRGGPPPPACHETDKDHRRQHRYFPSAAVQNR